MKNFIFILILLMTGLFLYGQGFDNDDYIIGTGEDRDLEKADKKAMQDLCSQISVQVKVSYVETAKETNGKSEEVSQQMINTFSSLLLDNVEKVVQKTSTGYKVMRKLKKADKERIFSLRVGKVREYIRNAEISLRNNDIGLALKNYYWGLVLLKSVPDRNSIHLTEDNTSSVMYPWLQQKIQALINNTRITLTRKTDGADITTLYLNAVYEESPVSSLSLTYFDGRDEVQVKLKDGVGIVYMPKAYLESCAELTLQIDYEYLELLNDIAQDEEVKAVLESINSINFDNSKSVTFNVQASETKKSKKTELSGTVKANQGKTLEEVRTSVENPGDVAMVEKIVERILAYINSDQKGNVNDLFTDKGFDQFKKIMNYGKVRVFKGDYALSHYRYDNNLIIRSIPLEIEFKGQKHKIIKDDISLIVENGKIDWVNFTINDKMFEKNMKKVRNPDDLKERIKALNFIEYYKTVFSLKELDKVSDVFSDSALIFVGYVKAKAPVDKKFQDIISKEFSSENLGIQRYSKNQYIENLSKLFKNNEYINIQFSDVDLVKQQMDQKIYSVQMKQDYYSSRYSDKGYLVIYFDMSDEVNPKIFFRYWQPSKMTEGELDQLQEFMGGLRF